MLVTSSDPGHCALDINDCAMEIIDLYQRNPSGTNFDGFVCPSSFEHGNRIKFVDVNNTVGCGRK